KAPERERIRNLSTTLVRIRQDRRPQGETSSGSRLVVRALRFSSAKDLRSWPCRSVPSTSAVRRECRKRKLTRASWPSWRIGYQGAVATASESRAGGDRGEKGAKADETGSHAIESDFC